jgi:photosystem II stability/assembly factor-like uncharacterized protein
MDLRRIAVLLTAAVTAITACDVGGPYVGEPPGLPRSPSPENDAGNVALDAQLSWLCDAAAPGQTLTFDVYLGTENPPALVATSVGSTTYDPGQLFPGVRYYWKIVAYSAYGDKRLATEGPIWHFSTVQGFWTQFDSPSNADLNGIAFTDSGTGWAVGAAGTILRYDGISWTVVPFAKILDLNGIAVLGNDGWAVGEKGTVLRLSNGAWSDESLSTDIDLYDVALAGDGSGWLVGAGGTVFRLQSGGWSQVDVGKTLDLHCAAVYDAENAWLGGDYNTVLQWDGANWTDVKVKPQYPQPLNPVFLAASAYGVNGTPAVWAGGYGVSFSNSVNGEWTFIHSPVRSPVNGMHIKRETEYGWAVGDNAVLAFFDGNSWSLYSEGGVTGDLNDVFTVGKNQAWAVGDGGAIYRFTPAAP